MPTHVEPKTCAYCNRVYKQAEDFYRGTSRWRICDQKNLWFNCACSSTLMVPSGKFPWYSPARTMSAQAASVFNALSDLSTLPHISASVMEIQQMLQKDEVEVSALAKKIRTDPLSAANLLSLANNMKSNRDPHDRKKIESLDHAIVFVGKRPLSDLLMAISLKMFPSKCKVFQVEQFWKESFLIGDIAEALIAIVKFKGSKDELFISASLCNLGKFVAAICLPDKIDSVQTHVDNPKTLCTWREAEKKLNIPDHGVLGEIGATLWGLPNYVTDASGGHHQMKTNRPTRYVEHVSTNEIVALANQLSHWILLRPSRIDQDLLDKLAIAAKMSKGQLEDFCASLSSLVKRTTA
jgi:HD-like signal output (HDOD) protein